MPNPISIKYGLSELDKKPVSFMKGKFKGFGGGRTRGTGAGGAFTVAKKPIISQSVAGFLTDVMPPEKWEELKKQEISRYKTLPKDVTNLTDIIRQPISFLHKTPEEKRSALKGLETVIKPLLRLKEPIRPLVTGLIKKQPPREIAVKTLRSFLKPEVTPSIISETIPFTKWELQKKGIPSLIPRAIGEAIETLLVYGKPLKQLRGALRTTGQRQAFTKIERTLPLWEKAGVKFSAGMTTRDKIATILGRAQIDPKVGNIVAGILKTPTPELYAGLPVKFSAGDLVKVGKEVGKIISVAGPKAIIGVAGKEITKSLGDIQSLRSSVTLAPGKEWRVPTGPPVGEGYTAKVPTKKMTTEKAQKEVLKSIKEQGLEPVITDVEKGILIQGFEPLKKVKITPQEKAIQEFAKVAKEKIVKFKAEEPIVTDKVRIQEIKNSIVEGELILKSKKNIAGEKMSTEELNAVRRSVESAKIKIGIKVEKLPPHLQKLVDKQKDYIVEDVTPEGYAPTPPLPEIPGVLEEPTIKPPVAPPSKPPEYAKGFEGPEGEGRDVAVEYEKQKDIWIGKKDVRVLQTNIEKRNLQKETLTALGKTRYDSEIKEYDKAIQIYIDSKRNPEQVASLYDKLTPEQQKTVTLSQNLPLNIKAIADKISQSYETMGLEALESDVIKNVLDNYAARVWDIPKGKAAPFRKFGTTTKHAKHRRFETIVQGWTEGYNLKVEGATSNLQILKEEIVKTIEDKRFIKTLQKLKTIEGESLLSTKQLEGYVRIEHPNFKSWRWAGKAEEAKAYGKNFFVDKEGNLFERRELYAPKEQANNLNNILGISKLKGIPAIDTITKYNAITKAWILQSSFFHHLAFTRSYWFGTNQKKWVEMSPRQAYKQGIRAIEEENPIVMLGVKNGLTLGLKQDWNEELLKEKTIIGKILDRTLVTKTIKNKIMALRQKQSDFLFGEFGAGLKAKSFLIEYRNMLKKHPDKSPDELAKMVANLINDDFGGLHLQRLGRNPTVQHIFRLFALAPDWTESNVRTMVKAFRAGGKAETQFYRRFWAGILTKAVLLTVLANALLNGEDTPEVYSQAWEEGRFRWLDVDVTNIYKALGGKTENRKYFSVLGHFKDPLKFITHPIRSAQHKGSVVYRFFHEALTGVDWAGRKFTTVKELVGLDEKRAKGKAVIWTYGKKGPLEFNQIPSFILHSIKGWQPIQIQNLLGWLAGELEGFEALARSMGLRVATTYGKEIKAKIGRNPLSEKYGLLETRLKNPITEKYGIR